MQTKVGLGVLGGLAWPETWTEVNRLTSLPRKGSSLKRTLTQTGRHDCPSVIITRIMKMDGQYQCQPPKQPRRLRLGLGRRA